MTPSIHCIINMIMASIVYMKQLRGHSLLAQRKTIFFIVYDNYYDLITLFLKYNFPSINT